MARIKDEYLITPENIRLAARIYETNGVGDVARIMDVSTMTVYNLLKAGGVKMRNRIEAARVRSMDKSKKWRPPPQKRVTLVPESTIFAKAAERGISYAYRTIAERDWLVENQIRINQMEGDFNPKRHSIYQGATYQSSLKDVVC